MLKFKGANIEYVKPKSRGQKSSNFFKLSTLIFCSFLDNVAIIVNEICF